MVIDLSSAATRATIVEETRRLMFAEVPGSYVAGTTRPFDGAQLDLEPSGLDEIRFGHYKALVVEIRSAWSGHGSRRLGVAAHELGDDSPWEWSARFYYEMALLVDHVAAMTYTTGITDGDDYRTWIAAQTRDVLRAVSGEDVDGDPLPAPSNGARVFIGLSAMGASRYHDPTAENIQWAAPGVDAGVVTLIDQGSRGARYFQGGAVYLHSDGTGNDGYASWATDWWWFGRRWLGRW